MTQLGTTQCNFTPNQKPALRLTLWGIVSQGKHYAKIRPNPYGALPGSVYTEENMNASQTKTLIELLEPLVDTHGLSAVLHEVERLCAQKAAHIHENWQDAALANEWEAAATKIGLMADSIAL